MAELNMPQTNGKRKSRTTLRVDLTPMVDLGFLLITFFMYTTTMAKPKAMDVNMPATSIETTAFPEESTITIIPTSGHKMVYYLGSLKGDGQLRYSSLSNLRNVILQMKSVAANLPTGLSAQAHKLHVVIKPNDDSKYNDLVQVLDEMSISDITYYALVDITQQERDMLAKK